MKKKESIITHLEYWQDDSGAGDEYRSTHDLDCILCGGDLKADTILSLWLPLRYTLNHFDTPVWQHWKDVEYAELRPKGLRLKNHPEFLNDMVKHIDNFLPDSELTGKLSALFELGRQPCNVMRLPKRQWNSLRGMAPYFDYLPHFLSDLFAYSVNEDALRRWLEAQSLEPFFEKGLLDQDHIRDLAGTGSVRRHNPRDIKLESLLDNYIEILRQRKELLAARTA